MADGGSEIKSGKLFSEFLELKFGCKVGEKWLLHVGILNLTAASYEWGSLLIIMKGSHSLLFYMRLMKDLSGSFWG